jgi:hypothetical protein
MTGEITFGEFTLSSIVVILLGVTFQAVPKIPDRFKNLISLLFGLGLGLLGIVCQEAAWTPKIIALHCVAGVMYGVGAIGTYHTVKKAAP